MTDQQKNFLQKEVEALKGIIAKQEARIKELQDHEAMALEIIKAREEEITRLQTQAA